MTVGRDPLVLRVEYAKGQDSVAGVKLVINNRNSADSAEFTEFYYSR